MTGYAITHKSKGIKNIPKSYKDAEQFLGNKVIKKVCNNTLVIKDMNDDILLKLHDTVVVIWYKDGRIKLNSGGYKTVTTKSRINAALKSTEYFVGSKRMNKSEMREYYGEYYNEYCAKSVWWLYREGYPVGAFNNGMTIYPPDFLPGFLGE